MGLAQRNNHDTSRSMVKKMVSIYETEEWKSLPVKERYCLLPTLEDIRPGGLVNISKDKSYGLEYCLSEKGFKYCNKNNLWLISKDEIFLEETFRKWESFLIANAHKGIDKDIDDVVKEIGIEYHMAMGKFLGYPDCCVNQFIDSTIKGLLSGRKWEKKAGKALLEGNYDLLFDYTLHVPCGISCEESLKIGEKIKNCLEAYDKEAAEHLRKFNMDSIERAAKKCITT